MNNSYDRGSLPGWMEHLAERITYHREHRLNAIALYDYDSADIHAAVIDELKLILTNFGYYDEPEVGEEIVY
jgi:hypothetical protein